MLKSLLRTKLDRKENVLWVTISPYAFENKRYHTWNYHLKINLVKRFLK